jgi:hypothetical protein
LAIIELKTYKKPTCVKTSLYPHLEITIVL